MWVIFELDKGIVRSWQKLVLRSSGIFIMEELGCPRKEQRLMSSEISISSSSLGRKKLPK